LLRLFLCPSGIRRIYADRGASLIIEHFHSRNIGSTIADDEMDEILAYMYLLIKKAKEKKVSCKKRGN
jgi:hypothetical protein